MITIPWWVLPAVTFFLGSGLTWWAGFVGIAVRKTRDAIDEPAEIVKPVSPPAPPGWRPLPAVVEPKPDASWEPWGSGFTGEDTGPLPLLDYDALPEPIPDDGVITGYDRKWILPEPVEVETARVRAQVDKVQGKGLTGPQKKRQQKKANRAAGRELSAVAS